MSDSPFQYAKVFPSYGKGHHLQWKLDPASNPVEPHNFVVETSGDIQFSELLASADVGNLFFYVDKSNIRQSLENNYYYRIKLVDGEGKSYYSKVFSPDAADYDRRQYVLAAEVARKEMLRIYKYVGGEAWLLKLKTYGKDATDNSIDPVTGLAMTATGPNYGFTKPGGFYKPVVMHFGFDQSDDIKKLSPDGAGVIEMVQAIARTIGYPLIDTNDILVEKEQDRCWIVKDRQATLFPGTSLIVCQTLKISLLPNTDPIYSIDVPVHKYEPG
jgi:hypothetical protein